MGLGRLTSATATRCAGGKRRRAQQHQPSRRLSRGAIMMSIMCTEATRYAD
jgi:hypothetical protein